MQEVTQNNVGVRKRGGSRREIPGHTLSRVDSRCVSEGVINMGGRRREGTPTKKGRTRAVLQSACRGAKARGYGLTETVALKGWQSMPRHSMRWPRQCAQAQFPAPSLAPSKLLIKVSLLPHMEQTQLGAVERREELRTWLLNETCFPGNDETHVTQGLKATAGEHDAQGWGWKGNKPR